MAARRKRACDVRAHPLAAQLKAARKAKGLSQAALAEITGYDRFVLARWENGQTSPTLARLIDWAGTLGFELRLRPKSDFDTTRALQDGAGANTRSMPMFGASGLQA